MTWWTGIHLPPHQTQLVWLAGMSNQFLRTPHLHLCLPQNYEKVLAIIVGRRKPSCWCVSSSCLDWFSGHWSVIDLFRMMTTKLYWQLIIIIIVVSIITIYVHQHIIKSHAASMLGLICLWRRLQCGSSNHRITTQGSNFIVLGRNNAMSKFLKE